MDLNTMTFYTIALCADCGCETIGGRGHFVDCKPVDEPEESRLERVIMKANRELMIARLAKARS
jgi:hypothetical protein